MAENSFFTKGDKEEMVSRIGQVHTITLFCPLGDFCVRSLRDTFEIMLSGYKVNDNLWKGVPAIDALNAFIFANTFQDKFGLDVDKDIIGIILSSLKMFKRLKLINFQFTDDEEIMNTYNILLKKTTTGIKKYIYKVELLELNLSDMFSQRVIDMLNKLFIHNELIPNSYLERKFKINFSYNDYMSFMEMFLNNNKEDLDTLDTNIAEYLGKFPKLLDEQKPKIRLLTNYRD